MGSQTGNMQSSASMSLCRRVQLVRAVRLRAGTARLGSFGPSSFDLQFQPSDPSSFLVGMSGGCIARGSRFGEVKAPARYHRDEVLGLLMSSPETATASLHFSPS